MIKKHLKDKKLSIKINEQKTEFVISYVKNDGTVLNYDVFYDPKNRIVIKMNSFKNKEIDFTFKKDNYKNSEDSDKILKNQFAKMIEDINLNAKIMK